MNNWLLIGIAALIVGPVLIGMGSKQARKGDEPPQLVQYGYLAVVIGAFVLLVQFFSIAAAMLVFVRNSVTNVALVAAGVSLGLAVLANASSPVLLFSDPISMDIPPNRKNGGRVIPSPVGSQLTDLSLTG